MRTFGKGAAPAILSQRPVAAAGERHDADAGLQFLNARYYDPSLALFIQPDWFEVTKAGVGTNRYSYSFNDLVNKIDPAGNNFANAPGDYDFSEEQAIKERNEIHLRDLDLVADGLFPDRSIGNLVTGPGTQPRTREFLKAIHNGEIGPQTSSMPSTEAKETIRDIEGQYPERSFVCDQACGSLVGDIDPAKSVAAGIAVVGGITAGTNDVPVKGKFLGTTPGTSAASIAARQALGTTKLGGGIRLPAPTAKKPLATSNRAATVLGRLGPIAVIAGGMIAGSSVLRHDEALRQCSASCLSVEFLDR